MISILNEIQKLRNGAPINIDHTNSNRCRVLLKEKDGSKTAYYFSTPIYNEKTRKAVDMKFHITDGTVCLIGSNANVRFSNRIMMENREGYCSISLKHTVGFISDRELASGNDRIYPTTNGFLYRAFCADKGGITFDMDVDKSFVGIRENDRSVSLMSQKFRPFFTISCIGTEDMNGEIVAPAKIAYQQVTDKKYRFTVAPGASAGRWVVFEANLYEDKLVQDTTVESANPLTNNAFGTSAFIGTTEQYGEQWLYSKINYQKISDMTDKGIEKIILHLPKYNSMGMGFDAFKVMARFCSFGSNWSNKIPGSSFVSKAVETENYFDLDITRFLSDANGRFMHTDGIILKPRSKDGGCAVIATGDSYYKPQIFEVNFRDR